MQIYPCGDGFGVDGLAITAAGVVYRFDRPAHRVLIRNAGANPVYVGFNEVIEGLGLSTANSILQGRPTEEAHRLATITVAAALAKGVQIPVNDEKIFECIAGGNSGRKAIYCIWGITEVQETATIMGGVLGM